jgi:hypothetical protein
VALETQTPAAQLAEIADVFRVELPVACAYVKRLDVTLEERRAPGATLPVVVVLDSEGGKRVIACDEARADDGREILIPLDGVDSSLLPGVFDSFVADALALARLARDGQATTDERWERLLADARDALGR